MEWPDTIASKWFSDKEFTPRKGYHFLQDGGVRLLSSKVIWKLWVPEKARLFAWLCANNKIPTKANLFRKRRLGNTNCTPCGDILETSDHLMLGCPFSRTVWTQLLLDLYLPELPSTLDILWCTWRPILKIKDSSMVLMHFSQLVCSVFGKNGAKGYLTSTLTPQASSSANCWSFSLLDVSSDKWTDEIVSTHSECLPCLRPGVHFMRDWQRCKLVNWKFFTNPSGCLLHSEGLHRRA